MTARLRKIAATAGLLLLAVLILASGAWNTLALLYSGPAEESVRTALALMCGLIALSAAIALAIRPWRWRVTAVHCVVFIAVLGWFFALEPSNDREWQTDVAVLPYATIDGDIVTMHN